MKQYLELMAQADHKPRRRVVVLDGMALCRPTAGHAGGSAGKATLKQDNPVCIAQPLLFSLGQVGRVGQRAGKPVNTGLFAVQLMLIDTWARLGQVGQTLTPTRHQPHTKCTTSVRGESTARPKTRGFFVSGDWATNPRPEHKRQSSFLASVRLQDRCAACLAVWLRVGNKALPNTRRPLTGVVETMPRPIPAHGRPTKTVRAKAMNNQSPRAFKRYRVTDTAHRINRLTVIARTANQARHNCARLLRLDAGRLAVIGWMPSPEKPNRQDARANGANRANNSAMASRPVTPSLPTGSHPTPHFIETQTSAQEVRA